MSQDLDSPLVPIKPRPQNAFIKNTPNRASFCGVPTQLPINAFINRKSWCGDNETRDLTIFEVPELGSFKGTGGTFPRKSKGCGLKGGLFTPTGNRDPLFLTGNEVRRCNGSGRRYAEPTPRSSVVLENDAGGKPNPSSGSEVLDDSRSAEDDDLCLLDRPCRPGRDRVDGNFCRQSLRQMRRFLPIDVDQNSLNQSRDSSSSGGERGDCSSSPESTNSSETLPGEISIQERLLRTHPVWFLPGIHRAGAFHLLQGKEEGNFIVRQSSQLDTLAISVRLPRDKGPYIEHYLIQKIQDQLSLETSQNKFATIPDLITHYAQCCDELPVQLLLPRPLRECETRQQLNRLALLGQEFWRYPESDPSPTIDSRTSRSGSNTNDANSSCERLSSFKSTPKPVARPNTLSLTTTVLNSPPAPPPRRIAPAPPGTTPLQNGAEITSQNNQDTSNQQDLGQRLSPECESTISKSLASLHNSFKRPAAESPDLIGSNSITSGIFSPTSQISNSILSKGCFSPESQLCSPISSSGIFSPMSESICSPVSGNVIFAGNTSRSRRSKRGSRKESKHYQETDILNSPDVYCRSSLQDKISDYEDIWQTERDAFPCSTFKPNNSDDSGTLLTSLGSDKNSEQASCESNESRNGIMLSRRPDLLPDTLPKLLASKSNQSLLDKEPLISKSDESIDITNGAVASVKNSKVDLKAKRPNKLEFNTKKGDDEDNLVPIQNSIDVSSMKKDKQSSPFYSEPVDSIVKNSAIKPVVQRRRLLRAGMNLAQRYSEPPAQPYKPLQDIYGSQNICPSPPNDSGSTDNLLPSEKTKTDPSLTEEVPFIKSKPNWTVDSSWEFIDKQEEHCFASVEPEPLTLHRLLLNRYPELLSPSTRSPRATPRASCYDNMPARIHDELASDDGTVFSEPWDSSRWDKLVPHDESSDVESKIMKSPLFNGTLTRNRTLRSQSTASKAGKTVKEYALKLASDQTTSFARHIQNFIVCTLGSKEKCPEVMMRNMRQFMSGMKNYLVKHGEKEFSKEVERERQKLKPTEFLNLDAILEEVMVRTVIKPLKRRLYTLLVDSTPRPACVWSMTLEQLELENDMIPPEESMQCIAQKFLLMQESDSPLEKLDFLVNILDEIAKTTSSNAENIARVLAWCAHDCGADVALGLEARVLALAPTSYIAQPKVACALSTLHRAAALLNSADQRSIVVVWPDETDGRLVALRPQTGPETNKVGPLARAAAAHAGVHNIANYALYLLERRNGQIHETILADNDDIEEVMAGKRCITAYKRIDSKIAWPHDVFDLARDSD